MINAIQSIEFLHAHMFWLLLLLPLAIAWYIWTYNRQQASVHLSGLQGFKSTTSWLVRLRPILFIMRLLALTSIIIALARPHTTQVTTKIKTTEGIDIVLSIDVSASMLAEDFEPNRLEATKDVAQKFIKGRPNDRIGVVVFAGESYTKTPITTDKSIVLRAVNDIAYDGILENGTAIGMGLATAVNRLKDSKAISKVIILMTDGVNNSGFMDPTLASDLAIEYGIKVYTIGIGSKGNARSPVALIGKNRFRMGLTPVEIDEQLLKEIANTTGGSYYRATNNKKLQEIYNEIDQLEKTEIEEFKFKNTEEKFRPFVLFALALITLEALLRYTLFKTIA